MKPKQAWAAKRTLLPLTLTLLVLPMTSMQASAAEIEVGGTYTCDSVTPDKDVLIWVGRIDTHKDANGTSNGTIVSASIRSTGSDEFPSLGHAPIDATMFDGCVATSELFPEAARANFEEGYSTWRAAYDKNEGGFWTLPPSEVYWTVLGVIEP
jgi:hypothetical protein